MSVQTEIISTHAPAGGATETVKSSMAYYVGFLLTPLREGRPGGCNDGSEDRPDFYSRPCGRGDDLRPVFFRRAKYFYSRPCGRGDKPRWKTNAGVV